MEIPDHFMEYFLILTNEFQIMKQNWSDFYCAKMSVVISEVHVKLKSLKMIIDVVEFVVWNDYWPLGLIFSNAENSFHGWREGTEGAVDGPGCGHEE